MLKYGQAPFLECSSKGFKKFSAFYARIRSLGNKTIEELYQAFKIFEDGQTGLSWKQAKGRKPANVEQCKQFYQYLWNLYIFENPQLLEIINSNLGFSDMFGKIGSNCQAEALYNIKINGLR